MRRLLRCVGLIALLVVVGGVASEARAAESAGRIVRMVGSVRVAGHDALPGGRVVGGETVTVAEDTGYADVRLRDGSLIRLRGGSFSIRRDTGGVRLTVPRGRIFVSVRPVSSGRFEIVTPVAVAGVRGTKFLVDAGDTQLYICVCEGVVSAQAETARRGIMVEAGEDISLGTGGRITKKPHNSPMMVSMTRQEFADMEP